MKRRITALVLAVLLALSLSACIAGTDQDGASVSELALVTDVGTIDDRSFNQGAWEGLVEFAQARDVSYMYWRPAGASDAAYLDAIEQAVEAGARLIVTPGFLFEVAVYNAATLHPDTKFVLLDGVPHAGDWVGSVGPNVVSVLYAEEQAGFLAGYAAVMDGFTQLGFIGGMAVPAVVRFGYGFLQGAEYAAAALGIDSIYVNYFYTGNFIPTPETQLMAASWFNAGTEVIFAAAGGAGGSVMAAAEANDGLVIGVDLDQSYESPTVITSAMKGLGASVYAIIYDYFAGNFPGGEIQIFDASNNGVGLPMETSQFRAFTVEQYEAIFARLAAGEIDVIDDHTITFEELGLNIVNVTSFN